MGTQPEDRSASTTEDVPFVAVARVLGAWGLHGHVRVELLTDFPERLAEREQVYLGARFRPVRVEEATVQRRSAVLKLHGIGDAEHAAALRGQLLYVAERDLAPLPEGAYYWHQIIGLIVETTEGQRLGRVVEILRTGSNDVYVVRDAGREVLVPAIDAVIRKVDLSAGLMIIDPLPGML